MINHLKMSKLLLKLRQFLLKLFFTSALFVRLVQFYTVMVQLPFVILRGILLLSIFPADFLLLPMIKFYVLVIMPRPHLSVPIAIVVFAVTFLFSVVFFDIKFAIAVLVAVLIAVVTFLVDVLVTVFIHPIYRTIHGLIGAALDVDNALENKRRRYDIYIYRAAEYRLKYYTEVTTKDLTVKYHTQLMEYCIQYIEWQISQVESSISEIEYHVAILNRRLSHLQRDAARHQERQEKALFLQMKKDKKRYTWVKNYNTAKHVRMLKIKNIYLTLSDNFPVIAVLQGEIRRIECWYRIQSKVKKVDQREICSVSTIMGLKEVLKYLLSFYPQDIILAIFRVMDMKVKEITESKEMAK
jgi:hypothetical protein